MVLLWNSPQEMLPYTLMGPLRCDVVCVLCVTYKSGQFKTLTNVHFNDFQTYPPAFVLHVHFN